MYYAVITVDLYLNIPYITYCNVVIKMRLMRE